MSLINYTLLVGAIAIVVGILLCLGILSLLGQYHIGSLFQREQAAGKETKPLWDIDHRRLREIYNLISKLTATLKY